MMQPNFELRLLSTVWNEKRSEKIFHFKFIQGTS